MLRSQGAFDQAVAHLRRAVAAHPDHVRLARALGYTLSHQLTAAADRLPSAAQEFREALRQAVGAFGPTGWSVELGCPATPEAVFWSVQAARDAARDQLAQQRLGGRRRRWRRATWRRCAARCAQNAS